MNTSELILAAYRHVALQHALKPPTREEIMVHMGKSLREIYQGLFPGSDLDALVKSNGEFILEHSMEIEGYEGLRDMLLQLTANGLQLAVLTGGNHKVEDLLRHHGIAHFFGSVVHSERITKQKPDPEGLLLALKELGATPAEAIMVGDMRYDILTGKNGGVAATIGLTHGFGSREELEGAGADYVVDSLPEVARILHDIR